MPEFIRLCTHPFLYAASKRVANLRATLLTATTFCLAWSLCVPTASANTLCVNTTGSGGCYASIQTAVNAAAGGDTINIGAGTYFENLSISTALTLNGAGPATIIDGAGARVVTITGGSANVVNIANLTIQHGIAFLHGGGIANGDSSTGSYGATLTISGSVITANHAGFGGGGGSNQVGGGIWSNGPLTIVNSTISNNSSDGDVGGVGIFGTTGTIANSTVSGNSAGHTECCGFGGGVGNGGTMRIVNTTISGNQSLVGYGGGIGNGGVFTLSFSTVANNGGIHGGGISNFGAPVTVKNSIVANSSSGPDCGQDSGQSGVISLGGNFDTSGTCGFTSATPATLNLGALQVNAPGTTATHALSASSVAIDGALDRLDATGAPVTTDQRSVARPQGAQCDSGSFEVVPPVTIASVSAQVASLASVIGAGAVNSLTSTLSAAQASAARGNRTAAANQLNAFINKVQALARSRRLDATTSGVLIGAAPQLINQL